jgi:branched-chain amino acid transport system ATP-binding protein
MTVIGNLNLGAYLQNEKKAVAEVRESILERFPILRERKGQLAGTLSGGEQQMLAIGRTLMSRPKLLLLDEPSLGLSPLLVSEIARIITSIHTQGVAIILVEQNANMALELANTGFVLETGRIVLQGPANELKENEHVRRAYLGG